MKKGWAIGVLGDGFTKGSSNLSLKKIESDDGPFPVYGAKGFVKNVSFFDQENEYLAVIKDGAGIGRVSTHPPKSSVLATMQYLLPKEGFSFGFLRYYLEHAELQKYRVGSTIPHIYFKDYSSEPLPAPPLPEQQRIVGILDEAFAGIATAKANAEKNIENARALFESHLNEVFAKRGDGWVEKKLEDLCFKITDGTHQTPTYFEDGILFLSSKNVTARTVDWDNVKYIDEKQHQQMHKRVTPQRDDILLAKNGTTGVAALVDRDTVFDIYVSLALLRTKGDVSPRFLLHFINSPVAKRQFNKRLKGIGVPNLHLKEIREVVASYPVEAPLQEALVQQFDDLLSETQRLESIYQQKLAELEALKKSLLHQAFSGEL